GAPGWRSEAHGTDAGRGRPGADGRAVERSWEDERHTGMAPTASRAGSAAGCRSKLQLICAYAIHLRQVPDARAGSPGASSGQVVRVSAIRTRGVVGYSVSHETG